MCFYGETECSFNEMGFVAIKYEKSHGRNFLCYYLVS